MQSRKHGIPQMWLAILNKTLEKKNSHKKASMQYTPASCFP